MLHNDTMSSFNSMEGSGDHYLENEFLGHHYVPQTQNLLRVRKVVNINSKTSDTGSHKSFNNKKKKQLNHITSYTLSSLIVSILHFILASAFCFCLGILLSSDLYYCI